MMIDDDDGWTAPLSFAVLPTHLSASSLRPKMNQIIICTAGRNAIHSLTWAPEM